MFSSIPPRPLQVKNSVLWKGYGEGGLSLLFGVACAIAFSRWQFAEAQHLLLDARIWSTGLTAPVSQVSGRKTASRDLFNIYQWEVFYQDSQGEDYFGSTEFTTVLLTVDQSRPPAVRYLEDSPSQFVLSWAIDSSTGRWSGIILFVLFGVSFGIILFFQGLRCIREIRLAELCAQNSAEVRLHITKVVPRRHKGWHVADVYHFTGQDAAGLPLIGQAEFKLEQFPLYADHARTSLLGLVSPLAPQRPLVPAYDLHPFVSAPAGCLST